MHYSSCIEYDERLASLNARSKDKPEDAPSLKAYDAIFHATADVLITSPNDCEEDEEINTEVSIIHDISIQSFDHAGRRRLTVKVTKDPKAILGNLKKRLKEYPRQGHADGVLALGVTLTDDTNSYLLGAGSSYLQHLCCF